MQLHHNIKQISAAVVFGCFSIVWIWWISHSYAKPSKLNTERDSNRFTQATDTIRMTIGFVGDIMAHITQVKAQKVNDTTYDFNDNFQLMKPLFTPIDLMIGNLETVFGGSGIAYSTHPRFNTPDALAAALRDAGFDLLSTANNHMMDQGIEGMKRTISVIRNHAMNSTGSRLSSDELRYFVQTIQGIKISIAAFTYESDRVKGEVLINGLKIKKDDKLLVNSFTPFNLQDATDSLRIVTNAMMADSSELQVMIMHWGDEYKTKPNTVQQALADSLRKMGIDIVLGSHPHVIQPVVFERDPIQGKDFLVAYSSGNFISNHRFETKGNYYTEDGLFVVVEIEKIGEAKPRLKAVNTIPLWVNKYWNNGRNHFEVVPLESILNDSLSLKRFSKAQKQRMESSLKRTKEILSIK
ncbi:MAG: CapA family protein [Chloroherpetonaceae bacterium]|nr:CapA family protein [Chloroherpetonaceae bacterium]